ncbi:hypothetical protein Q7P35_006619 [Cladosporium inversicolor]
MPPCIEKARAIMRVLTVDMWNHKAKQERTRLWRMYCSPQIKAYTPDGGESTGYEEVYLVLSLSFCSRESGNFMFAASQLTNSQCDTQISHLQLTTPSYWKFSLTGDLYLTGNTFTQTWFLGHGVEGVEGWSVITVNARGEVISLHGVVEDARNPSVRQEEEPANPPPVVALGCWREGSVGGGGEGGFEERGRRAVA